MAHSERQRLAQGKRRSYGSLDDSRSEEKHFFDDENKTDNDEHDHDEHQQPTRRQPKTLGIISCWRWIKSDSSKNTKFTYFFVSLFIPPIVALLYSILVSYDDIIYIIAGIYGILFNIYAFNHFRLLFNLKREVEHFTKLNVRFKSEREQIDGEINKLSKGREALEETHQHLHTNNLQMVDMIRKFEVLEEQLSTINVTSVAKISDISVKATKLKSKYYDISLQQQRNILWRIFDRLEKGNEKGISKQDFDEFYSLLPSEHQKRFDRVGGFEALLKISDTPSKDFVDSQDFEKALDVYAQMHVENCDIKFRINRIKSKGTEIHHHRGQLKFIRSVTIIEKKRTKDLLNKQDVWLLQMMI